MVFSRVISFARCPLHATRRADAKARGYAIREAVGVRSPPRGLLHFLCRSRRMSSCPEGALVLNRGERAHRTSHSATDAATPAGERAPKRPETERDALVRPLTTTMMVFSNSSSSALCSPLSEQTNMNHLQVVFSHPRKCFRAAAAVGQWLTSQDAEASAQALSCADRVSG